MKPSTPAAPVFRSPRLPLLLSWFCFPLLLVAPARAQPEALDAEPAPAGAEQPAAPQTSDDPGEVSTTPSIADSLPNPDPGGVRAALGRRGVTYNLTYIGETLGNVSGGTRRGAVYQGLLDVQIDVDLERLAGLPGLSLHADAYQAHGRGLSRCCLGDNYLIASGIETRPGTRLYELWIEQELWGGRVAVRAGRLGADTEFFVSQYATLFVNGTFGWPAIAAANLPGNGSSRLVAAPGVRLKLAPTDGLTASAALFAAGEAETGDAAERGGRRGTGSRKGTAPLVLAEVAYAYNQGRGAAGLPGVVKLGGYHHFGRFDDSRSDAEGVSLADPNGSGIARRLRGNGGAYAVLDQLVWREPGTRDQGLGLFLRAVGSPSASGVIALYADGGVTYKGLFAGRVNDTLGLGVAYARFSRAARAADRDAARFDPAARFVRSSEAVVELSYQAEIVPGFTVQPSVQYIVRPGGGVENPRDPGRGAIKDAAVFGLRATLHY